MLGDLSVAGVVALCWSAAEVSLDSDSFVNDFCSVEEEFCLSNIPLAPFSGVDLELSPPVTCALALLLLVACSFADGACGDVKMATIGALCLSWISFVSRASVLLVESLLDVVLELSCLACSAVPLLASVPSPDDDCSLSEAKSIAYTSTWPEFVPTQRLGLNKLKLFVITADVNVIHLTIELSSTFGSTWRSPDRRFLCAAAACWAVSLVGALSVRTPAVVVRLNAFLGPDGWSPPLVVAVESGDEADTG